MTLFDRHHFHFFGTRERASLYVSLGLLHFGEGLMQVSIPVYLWKIGFGFPEILFFYFLKSFYFIILVALALPLIKRLSDKMMMFLSVPFIIVYFFGVSFIEELPVLFYMLPFAHALSMILFNIGYHMDFSGVLDEGRVGREVGTRYMIVSLFHFTAPFIGGVLISMFDFRITFFIGAVILFFATMPLFFFPQRNLSPRLNARSVFKFMGDRNLKFFTLSSAGYANELMVGSIIWPLFIFLSVGSIQQFGGLISLGLFTGTIAAYLTGFLSDAGRRRKVLGAVSALHALVWILRPWWTFPYVIAGSHIFGRITHTVLMVCRGSQYYTIARALPDPNMFILSQETFYQGVRVLFFPLLIIIAMLLPLDGFFSASFVIAAFLTLLMMVANKFHLRNLTL